MALPPKTRTRPEVSVEQCPCNLGLLWNDTGRISLMLLMPFCCKQPCVYPSGAWWKKQPAKERAWKGIGSASIMPFRCILKRFYYEYSISSDIRAILRKKGDAMSKHQRFRLLGSIGLLLLVGCLSTLTFNTSVAHAALTQACPPNEMQGNVNTWVTVIQFRLNNQSEGGISNRSFGNPFPLQTDGNFGLHTKMAVQDYQASNRLNPDGVVGDSTWTSLGFCTAGNAFVNALCCAGNGSHCPATISEGSTGIFVQALQMGLNMDADIGVIGTSFGVVNWFSLSIDGDFGRNTKAAVESFQSAPLVNITVDGQVGPMTWGIFGMCY